ncbi:cytochrome P450 [Laetiporus sulphureus 93-53]|uniref:Cytochrome P450 n=1 Tax=Laetiporus sulphureus 93-53 TaxID=1314785 RepID=A0A165HWB6_9APHY|nr:cytochrome P450 [Laetiporus sulphureus 93-53]KZT12276.1 cytochrome P450 [Laetiporus sulphureus 93-53]
MTHSLVVQLVAIAAVLLLWKIWRSHHVLDNIPGPPRQSWFHGNVRQFASRHASDFQRHVAFAYGSVVRLHGVMGAPMLYVSDPKALHAVIMKDEQIYQESDTFIVMNNLIFGPGLLSTLGEHHRKQRKMLNPVFSVAHMRRMLPLFYQVVYKLRDAIQVRVDAGAEEVDVLNWMSRAGLEMIGQGGLGYSFDPLTADTNDDYGDALKSFNTHVQAVQVWQRIAPYLIHLGPAWLRAWLLDRLPDPDVRGLKKLVDTMDRRSREIYQEKQTAFHQGDEVLVQRVGEGKDIMSILMRANMTADESDKLPESELIAQMSTFILAGMDTTSNTVSRMLHLLAENPQVQDKVREEVLAADAAKGISYDDLNRLPLLDAVCRETLRLYPPATILSRVPNQDVILPLSEPMVGKDGKTMSEIPIPKGTEIIIGVLGSNANKVMWGEDSLEWKPQRWLSGPPKGVADAGIPGAYSHLMTFMGGKRACIGFKFSEMEMKVLLSVLLSTFVFESTGKPIEWNVSGVYYPTVGKESNTPSLPLKIRFYKGVTA